MCGTVSGLAYGHLVCYSVSAPNPCSVNERLPPSLTTQNWNCISRCPRCLMVCISESITDALRHQENRCVQHSTHVPLWLTVAEIGRTLSKPVKFVLADKKSEHKRNATPFGKRNKNRKSKTNPLPRIMNHMVERDSQNDVPEEMDITEGMKPQQLLMLFCLLTYPYITYNNSFISPQLLWFPLFVSVSQLKSAVIKLSRAFWIFFVQSKCWVTIVTTH